LTQFAFAITDSIQSSAAAAHVMSSETWVCYEQGFTAITCMPSVIGCLEDERKVHFNTCTPSVLMELNCF